jgi:hypothetical protein
METCTYNVLFDYQNNFFMTQKLKDQFGLVAFVHFLYSIVSFAIKEKRLQLP